MSTFPPSTELIVGPASWPGWPSNPDAELLDSHVPTRTFREIGFDGADGKALKDAVNFFGDGSLYLLNAPGHALGRMRTTAEPRSLVFMIADACHNAGVLGPTKYVQLPAFHYAVAICSRIRQ